MIKNEISYNAVTGEFSWVNSGFGRQGSIGSIATSRNKKYLVIRFDGKPYQAHRLAIFLHTGSYPEKGLEVDHIDGNGLNNKYSNLRVVTASENQRNASLRSDNMCGFTGVRFVKRGNRAPYWHARIKVNRKDISLGCHKTIIDAVAARIRANKEYGFTKRHGR